MHEFIQELKRVHADLGRIPSRNLFRIHSRLPNSIEQRLFGTWQEALAAAGLAEQPENIPKAQAPKLLYLDIETKPIKAWVWDIFDQNIPLEMIIEDWSVLSICWKWGHEEEPNYVDVSEEGHYTHERKMLEAVFKVLDECDVLITQNGKRFDEVRLNAKFEEYGMGRPSFYKHIDTYRIKKRHLGFTSKKLEYSTNKLNEKYKKQKHDKYPGNKLHLECLAGNKEAWADMRVYNTFDVLSLEELYVKHLRKWDNTINYGVYLRKTCCVNCGSENIILQEKLSFTKSAVHLLFKCSDCGSYSQSRENELNKQEKRRLLK